MAPPPGGLQGYMYCMAVIIKSRAVRRDVGTVINKSKVYVADSRVVSIGVSKAVISGCCVSVQSGLSVGKSTLSCRAVDGCTSRAVSSTVSRAMGCAKAWLSAD